LLVNAAPLALEMSDSMIPATGMAINERNCSLALFQFFEQLLFQMPARCLFNCAPLCHYGFLFHLAFSPCSWFDRLRQVPDLWPMRADFSLFWFCVRIHAEVSVFGLR
jgi:hypothetical protein